MLVQWCLKGIAEGATGPEDALAQSRLGGPGLKSSWLFDLRGNADIFEFPERSHKALSYSALDAHVHSYSTVGRTTPYISLSAGCVELDPFTPTTTTIKAWETALDFATRSGTQSGFVYRLWVLVSPKPAPELPGFAEEVRELNSFDTFAQFHHEGEITAKLFVPARQIEWVEKYDRDLSLLWRARNPDFVPPERVSNLLDYL
jgi:hypothetical protein